MPQVNGDPPLINLQCAKHSHCMNSSGNIPIKALSNSFLLLCLLFGVCFFLNNNLEVWQIKSWENAAVSKSKPFLEQSYKIIKINGRPRRYGHLSFNYNYKMSCGTLSVAKLSISQALVVLDNHHYLRPISAKHYPISQPIPLPLHQAPNARALRW